MTKLSTLALSLISCLALTACDSGAAGRPARGTAASLPLEFSKNPPAWRSLEAPPLRYLTGVSATDRQAVFVVGSTKSLSPANANWDGSAPAAALWDGDRWRQINSGLPPDLVIEDVVAASADDAWAAGVQHPGGSREQERLFHWDGRSWQPVPEADEPEDADESTPYLAPDGAAWRRTNFGGGLTYRVGNEWKQQELPAECKKCLVLDLDARSGTDAWAVAEDVPGGPTGQATRRTFVLHWDGKSWTTVHDSGDPGRPGRHNAVHPTGGNRIATRIAAGSATGVWAIGEYCQRWRTVLGDKYGPVLECVGARPMAMHWDGHGWRDVSMPRLPDFKVDSRPYFGPLVADGRGHLWSQVARGQFVHYDGHRWSLVNTPDGPAANCTIEDMASIPDTSAVIAVGSGGCVRSTGTLP